jgi:hypothetical protein
MIEAAVDAFYEAVDGEEWESSPGIRVIFYEVLRSALSASLNR